MNYLAGNSTFIEIEIEHLKVRFYHEVQEMEFEAQNKQCRTWQKAPDKLLISRPVFLELNNVLDLVMISYRRFFAEN